MSVRGLLHTLRIWSASSPHNIRRGVPVATVSLLGRHVRIRPFRTSQTTPALLELPKPKSRFGFHSRLLGSILGAGAHFQAVKCYSDGTTSSLPGAGDSSGGVVIPEKGQLGSSEQVVNMESSKVNGGKPIRVPFSQDGEFETIDMEELLHGDENLRSDDDVGLPVARRVKIAFLGTILGAMVVIGVASELFLFFVGYALCGFALVQMIHMIVILGKIVLILGGLCAAIVMFALVLRDLEIWRNSLSI